MTTLHQLLSTSIQFNVNFVDQYSLIYCSQTQLENSTFVSILSNELKLMKQGEKKKDV